MTGLAYHTVQTARWAEYLMNWSVIDLHRSSYSHVPFCWFQVGPNKTHVLDTRP